MTSFYRRYGKRALDLALTVPALVLLSPLLGLVAATVWLTMGRPVGRTSRLTTAWIGWCSIGQGYSPRCRRLVSAFVPRWGSTPPVWWSPV